MPILDVCIVGKAYLPEIGGGPIIPPTPGQPPGIWGPTDPRPTPPIHIPPTQPGQPPGIWPPSGVVTPPIYYPPEIWPTPPAKPPLGIWGGAPLPVPTPPIYIPLPPDSDLKPEHPIVLPPGTIPGFPAHPIVIVPPPPADGGVKPPPPEGGWGYSPEHGWGYFPPQSDKPQPAPTPPNPDAPHVEPH